MKQVLRYDYAFSQAMPDYDKVVEPFTNIAHHEIMQKFSERFKFMFESRYDVPDMKITQGWSDVPDSINTLVTSINPKHELLREHVGKCTDEEFEKIKVNYANRNFEITCIVTISVSIWGDLKEDCLSEELSAEIGEMVRQIMFELKLRPKKKFYNKIYVK